MKKILLLISLIIFGCQSNSNIEIINNINNDKLTEQVSIIEVSDYSSVIKNLNNTINSSIYAWENSPELGQYNRVKSIRIVTNKFLNKLNRYENDDKVIAYQFIKSYKNKKYIGYTVVIFDKYSYIREEKLKELGI